MLVEPATASRAWAAPRSAAERSSGSAAALFGERDFDAIAALAQRGDRRRVDLLVSDIYPDGDFLLPGDVNAASFAKLARARRRARRPPTSRTRSWASSARTSG